MNSITLLYSFIDRLIIEILFPTQQLRSLSDALSVCHCDSTNLDMWVLGHVTDS